MTQLAMVVAVDAAAYPADVGASVDPNADTKILTPAAAYALWVAERVAASIKVHSCA